MALLVSINTHSINFQLKIQLFIIEREHDVSAVEFINCACSSNHQKS